MPVANGAQAFQIALRRHEDAGGARDRLDNHRGDGGGVMQGDETFQLIGKLGAMLGLTTGEAVLLRQMRVRQMIDPGQHGAEGLAVADDAADGNAAETGAVIAPLSPDQAGPGPLPPRPVIGERDLERRIHRFRSGVGEEDMIEAGGEHARHPRRQLKHLRMAHLEGGRVIQLPDLFRDRRNDARIGMTGVAAPETGRPVEDRLPLRIRIIHALGADQHPGVRLELAVCRKRHPVGIEVIGRRCGGI